MAQSQVAWLDVSILVLLALVDVAAGQGRDRNGSPGPAAEYSQILGSPTTDSMTLSVLASVGVEFQVEYGLSPGAYSERTPLASTLAGQPREIRLVGLRANTRYFYRVLTRNSGESAFRIGDECSFHTQREPGSTFVFALQGDSHPERAGKMFDADLYVQTMRNVSRDSPDFYLTMGDDFSIERLIERGPKTQEAVNAIYAAQRGFLGVVGKSAPLMLVNGNHEQAAKYLLDGTANNFAVFAGKARIAYFPLPAPNDFYSGNSEPVQHIGLLRDYYAWEWGDALFVVIDPYWHSSVSVDNEAGEKGPAQDGAGQAVERQRQGERNGAGQRGGVDAQAKQPEREAQPREGGRGGGRGQRDLWQITLGDAQYRWLSTTLHESKAKFKFVFSHHVLGTGRGGVEVAGGYEWGGQDRRGIDRFFEMRPTWDKPIHDLMRDTGVTIFFQGHDHLYARQELDGVTYQSCPNPADPTFTAFNRQAYRSGDVFPNSGHLRVTVSGGDDASCTVEYVRSARPADEAAHGLNGAIVHAYTVRPRAPGPMPLPKGPSQ